MALGPIVVFQYGDTIERHVFPDGDAFIAWIDSQETTVNIDVQPREEVISTMTSLDHCPACGKRVVDFEWDGFEAGNGQRGHTKCVKTVRWDTVHDRQADVYCPPEDSELRIVPDSFEVRRVH